MGCFRKLEALRIDVLPRRGKPRLYGKGYVFFDWSFPSARAASELPELNFTEKNPVTTA